MAFLALLQPEAAIAKESSPILLPAARLLGHRDRRLPVSEVAEFGRALLLACPLQRR